MHIDFQGRVAIVTGAGGGLGREHALALAARGARVLVNDLGAAAPGSSGAAGAAQQVADEIVAAGGQAMASTASVTDPVAVAAMSGRRWRPGDGWTSWSTTPASCATRASPR